MDHAYILKPGEALVLLTAFCTHDANTKEIRAIGCDFGSANSKLALSFKKDDRDPELYFIELSRLTSCPHENKSNGFELVAFVTLNDNGELVPEPHEIAMEYRIPLKTLLTYRSGITNEEVITKLPGGTALLKALTTRRVTGEKIDDLLLQHFNLLHRAAISQTKEFDVTIRVVVFTYPNYLCTSESKEYFNKYMDKYLSLMRSVWGDEVKFETVSEGHAATAYICEKFRNVTGTKNEYLHKEIFKGLDIQNGLNLLVVDAGASTLNLQAVSAYFSDDGQLSKTMSNVPDDAKTGAQGGSDASNSLAHGVILREHVDKLRSSKAKNPLAAYMADFEEKKKTFNYTQGQDLYIHDRESGLIQFPGPIIREVFESAFADGFQLLDDEFSRMLKLGRHFAVLFCGGSYNNPGLYEKTSDLMKKVQAKGRRKGVQIHYTFLRNQTYGSSAVSGGAAVGMVRVPFPSDVLRGSAIGLHEITKSTSRRGKWQGSAVAMVLYSGPSQSNWDIDDEIKAKERHRLKFHLVCDPNWGSRARVDDRQIPVGPDEAVLGGPPAAYDLGITIMASDIPCGKVRFCLEIASEQLGRWDGAIRLTLRCFKISYAGTRIPDKKNRQWFFDLKTGLQTKLLQVDDDDVMFPLHDCTACGQIVEGDYWECDECTNFWLCERCYDAIDNILRPHPHQLFPRLFTRIPSS
ncbi:hypothetical protein GGR51DRAFT_566746 [Nemania sp. FL0031]|nr:hypothetical protein GGR51DRAFT_566746 [Nemania sp. FL0031]